jgi:hypothetical protein
MTVFCLAMDTRPKFLKHPHDLIIADGPTTAGAANYSRIVTVEQAKQQEQTGAARVCGAKYLPAKVRRAGGRLPPDASAYRPVHIRAMESVFRDLPPQCAAHALLLQLCWLMMAPDVMVAEAC